MTLSPRLIPLIACLGIGISTAGCGDLFLSRDSRERIDQVRALVKADPSAANRPVEGVLPLVIAMETSSESLLEWLLDNGARPTHPDDRGNTPLHKAAIYDMDGRGALKTMLRTPGANPNVPDNLGETPLHLAASFAASGAIRELLKKGADPHATNYTGQTPLHKLGSLILPPTPNGSPKDTRSAARQPAAVAESMDHLLAAGARLDAKDRQGRQPLHAYAFAGSAAAVAAALARGANPNALTAAGQTALELAQGREESEAKSIRTAWKEMGIQPAVPVIIVALRSAGAKEPAARAEGPAATVAASPAASEQQAAGTGVAAPADFSPAVSVATPADPRPRLLAQQYGEVLFSDDYVADADLRAFIAKFRSGPSLALCRNRDRLIAAAPEITLTFCEARTTVPCNGGICSAEECKRLRAEEIEYTVVRVGASECDAIAFFLNVRGLKAGGLVVPIPEARREEGHDPERGLFAFRFGDRIFRPESFDRESPGASNLDPVRLELSVQSGDRRKSLAVLTLPPGELSCTSRPYMWDLNRDGEPDLMFRCNWNTYGAYLGLSLSAGAEDVRRVVLQRATGGYTR